jgi:hypothetical protein
VLPGLVRLAGAEVRLDHVYFDIIIVTERLHVLSSYSMCRIVSSFCAASSMQQVPNFFQVAQQGVFPCALVRVGPDDSDVLRFVNNAVPVDVIVHGFAVQWIWERVIVVEIKSGWAPPNYYDMFVPKSFEFSNHATSALCLSVLQLALTLIYLYRVAFLPLLSRQDGVPETPSTCLACPSDTVIMLLR